MSAADTGSWAATDTSRAVLRHGSAEPGLRQLPGLPGRRGRSRPRRRSGLARSPCHRRRDESLFIRPTIHSTSNAIKALMPLPDSDLCPDERALAAGVDRTVLVEPVAWCPCPAFGGPQHRGEPVQIESSRRSPSGLSRGDAASMPPSLPTRRAPARPLPDRAAPASPVSGTTRAAPRRSLTKVIAVPDTWSASCRCRTSARCSSAARSSSPRNRLKRRGGPPLSLRAAGARHVVASPSTGSPPGGPRLVQSVGSHQALTGPSVAAGLATTPAIPITSQAMATRGPTS